MRTHDHPDQPSFADLLNLTPPTEVGAPDEAPERQRRRSAAGYKYVRKVKGNKWQARVWVGVDSGQSVNLGLYDDEWSAGRAVKRWLRTGELPPGVLPKWSRRAAAGPWFEAAVRKAGKLIVLAPFATADAAHAAMAAHLATHFPRRVNPPRTTADQRRRSRPDQGRWVEAVTAA